LAVHSQTKQYPWVNNSPGGKMNPLKWTLSFASVAAIGWGYLESCRADAGRAAASQAVHISNSVVDDVRVTILGDMTVSRWTRGEWGFSALVEVKINGAWKKILFDTGAEPSTVAFNVDRLANQQKMKDAAGNPLSVCDADAVVLSHNHQDHTMGLIELRRKCAKINPRGLSTAYVGGPEIFWPRPYTQKNPSSTGRIDDNVMLAGNGIAKAMGFDPEYDSQGVKALYEATGGQFVIAANRQPMELNGLPGVWMTGSIPRTFDEKTYPGQPEIVDPSGKSATDTVPEDQALVINTSKGLVVITGCAHAGVVNTVQYVQKLATKPIYALLGGYHLFQEKLGDEKTVGTLTWVGAQLAPAGITYLLGAHCAGLESFAILRNLLKLDTTHAVYSTIATVFDLTKGIIPPGTALNKTPQP
jgi:7,8-dihydropterin-6-yl-methyl-4-(beta-D-ribofuranosyl)aminobenzene 5'-phosphate synthase